jgi:uncharacterized OsmC-like protein
MPSPPRNLLAETGKPVFFRAGPAGAALRDGGGSDAVRVVARSLKGMQKEALIVSARHKTTWRLASDEGAYLAGLDFAPCPLAFFTVGLVASVHAELLARCALQGRRVAGLRLILDSFYTMRGSALAGTMTGGARDARLIVQAESDQDPAMLSSLAQESILASPVAKLLHKPLTNRFSLLHNGHALDTAPLARCAEPDVECHDPMFDETLPVGTIDPALLVRGELTPPAAHSVAQPGSSLAAEQDRLLHVRGVSEARADGLLEIEQYLYNPHGTRFRFLCSPEQQSQETPRAPDPDVYASAGIAFCFMTQVGRYASIMKLPLSDTRVVQDTWFPAGAAAAPVATSLRVHSDARDEDARRALLMSEQTCFLHALCKSALKIRLAVQGRADGLPPAVVLV